MLHIIFNTEEEANALNNRVNFDLKETWKDGITDNYCLPKKHPTLDKWAIIIEPGYEKNFTAQEINSAIELTSDWNPIPNLFP